MPAILFNLLWHIKVAKQRSTRPVPEFIDPVFTKTSPKRSFSLNRKRAFWLVLRENRVYNFGHWALGNIKLKINFVKL
jgi:hypothetical protein